MGGLFPFFSCIIITNSHSKSKKKDKGSVTTTTLILAQRLQLVGLHDCQAFKQKRSPDGFLRRHSLLETGNLAISVFCERGCVVPHYLRQILHTVACLFQQLSLVLFIRHQESGTSCQMPLITFGAMLILELVVMLRQCNQCLPSNQRRFKKPLPRQFRLTLEIKALICCNGIHQW